MCSSDLGNGKGKSTYFANLSSEEPNNAIFSQGSMLCPVLAYCMLFSNAVIDFKDLSRSL